MSVPPHARSEYGTKLHRKTLHMFSGEKRTKHARDRQTERQNLRWGLFWTLQKLHFCERCTQKKIVVLFLHNIDYFVEAWPFEELTFPVEIRHYNLIVLSWGNPESVDSFTLPETDITKLLYLWFECGNPPIRGNRCNKFVIFSPPPPTGQKNQPATLSTGEYTFKVYPAPCRVTSLFMRYFIPTIA